MYGAVRKSYRKISYLKKKKKNLYQKWQVGHAPLQAAILTNNVSRENSTDDVAMTRPCTRLATLANLTIKVQSLKEC